MCRPIGYARLGLAIFIGFGALTPLVAVAQALRAGELPTDMVYRGQPHLPDFAARDKKYASYRMRIRDGMSTGPDFAGHYSIIQIGCGTECTFAFVGDVATGQVSDFPYGGEDYRQMQIIRSVKDQSVKVLWISEGRCLRDLLSWNGLAFISLGKVDLGPSEVCERF